MDEWKTPEEANIYNIPFSQFPGFPATHRERLDVVA
jgi:hypothetical protein